MHVVDLSAIQASSGYVAALANAGNEVVSLPEFLFSMECQQSTAGFSIVIRFLAQPCHGLASAVSWPTFSEHLGDRIAALIKDTLVRMQFVYRVHRR